MRFFALVFLVLISFNAHAVTRGNFMGINFIVNITSNSPDGSNDGSPQVLYGLMNRPEQNSMLGPGKSLEIDKKTLNFICAKKAENNYHCTILIHKTAFSQIGPGRGKFVMQGEQARALFNQFHTNGVSLTFKDEAGKTLVHMTPESFIVEYNEQGV